eukprot:5341713-Prymnesium_polylepis.1
MGRRFVWTRALKSIDLFRRLYLFVPGCWTMPNRHPPLYSGTLCQRGKQREKVRSGLVRHEKVRLRTCAHAAAQSHAAGHARHAHGVRQAHACSL